MAVMCIRARREAVGLTQRDVATGMGVVIGAVANWESEVALPKTREIPRLARVLSCSISDLFEQEEVPEDSYD